MIDVILALISTLISFNDEYNATHMLPLSVAVFTLIIFTVIVPFMLYMMRELPEQAIERITPIIAVYDKAIEDVARGHKAGVYTDAKCQAIVDEYKALRQPFLDELAALQGGQQ